MAVRAVPRAERKRGPSRYGSFVGMVWEREAIRFFRTRARILSSFIQPVLFLFVAGDGHEAGRKT
jgi:hypothetical protein